MSSSRTENARCGVLFKWKSSPDR